jgi:hypothetical protein
MVTPGVTAGQVSRDPSIVTSRESRHAGLARLACVSCLIPTPPDQWTQNQYARQRRPDPRA